MKKIYKTDNPKPGVKTFDLIGNKYGRLTVLSFYGINKYGNKLWFCKCECGGTKLVTTTQLRRGSTVTCGCGKYRTGNAKYNYTGYKDISGARWYTIKNNAKVRGIKFEITKEQVWELYLKQNKKCYFSKLNITFKDNTASVDRLDNDKGYTLDNIVIVQTDINMMKRGYSEFYFIKLCKHVASNN